MAPEAITPDCFSRDIWEFITLLQQHSVRYVVVGGEAVIYYGHARLTGDIDFFYDRAEKNVVALFEALKDFWSGKIPGLADAEEFKEPGLIVQFGVPPNRIDLLNQIDGIRFSDAWSSRTTVTVPTPSGKVTLHYIGLNQLIKNKQAAARAKDVEDLKFLRRLAKSK